TWCSAVEDAMLQVEKKSFDLILVDASLPEGNGLQFCASLQSKFYRVPIFILSFSNELAQKVLSFSAGADDYITKPFEPLELRARVSARLNKRELIINSVEMLRWKEIVINSVRQEVTVYSDGIEMNAELTSLEFKLLLFFAHHLEEALTRDEILDGVWGVTTYVNHRTVDTHVSKLRKKLLLAAGVIKSVHGRGYK